MFTKKPDSEIEELSNEAFLLKLTIEMNNKADLGQTVAKTIYFDFAEYSSVLKNTFRTSCFTTTPYSQFCNGKNIQYVGIMRNPNVFEMQECGIKCEDSR